MEKIIKFGKKTMQKVHIIGSGISSLATAIRLKVAGFSPVVYEKNSCYGGKIQQIKWNGYRFDTGPSVFTMPQLLEELFETAKRPIQDYISYYKPTSTCKYFFADGLILNAWNNKNLLFNEIEKKLKVPSKIIKNYLEHCAIIYKLTAPVFIFQAFHKFNKLMKRENLKTALNLHKIRPFANMHQINRRQLKEPHLVQLFDRYATYVGSNPYKAPATLNVISHLEHNLGLSYPKGGMFTIIEALYNLAKDLGVEFQFNQALEKIHVKHGRVEAITIGGNYIPAQIVVSGIDVGNLTEQEILPPSTKKNIHKNKLSSSALIYYWAMDKQFPELDLHNILFSKEYKEEFKCLFKEKTISPDATIYIYISSKENKNDALVNGENWFVMVNAPANTGQDWDYIAAEMKENIIQKIESRLNVKIREHIIFERIATPVTIEKETGSYKGALYGNHSNSPFAAFYRHANFDKRIQNLFYTGGSVHPGGGIPMCLASAKIVSDLILEKF